MAVSEEKKQQFISVMFNLVKALKNESDACCNVCGGFNEKELMIIVFIGQNQQVKMSDIAENLEAPLSTLTTIVDKLVEQKYLVRFHSTEDRRVVHVGLAQQGKEAYKIFLKQKQQLAVRALSHFSEKEQNTFMDYIGKLAASIHSKK